MASENGQAYLFARVTRAGSAFYPEVHPVAEARLERGLSALWDALQELAAILGGGPASFTVETAGAIISGYSGSDEIIVVASPKKWRAPEGSVEAANAHA